MASLTERFSLLAPSSYSSRWASPTHVESALMVEAKPPTRHPGRVLATWEPSFVCECIKVLLQLFHLHGFDDTGYSPESTKTHWMFLATHCESAMSLLKYKLAAFYSVWKDQELPPSPFPSHMDDPRVLLGGRCVRWIRLLSVRPNSCLLFESLVTSVLYSKKGMPRPGKSLLKKAQSETYKILTTAPPRKVKSLIAWGDVPADLPCQVNLELSRDSIAQEIQRTVQEVYGKSRMSRDDWLTPFFPSFSANYCNSRASGGAVGVVVATLNELGMNADVDSVVMEVVGTKRSSRVVVNADVLYQKFEKLFAVLEQRALTEVPYAVPVALPEALKVRVITKGPPYLNTVLKPLQKFLWSELRKCPVAALIGQPVSARFVQDRIGRALADDQSFLSVDYKSATDLLESWCSDVACDSIADCIGLSADQRTLFKRSLTGHRIVNPDVSDDEREHENSSKEQANGQLMGSITSFPVLCIINIAVCRWALELDAKRVFTLRDAPLCVNGDDAVMKCTPRGNALWKQISSYCGLTPSVGKVYFSKDFLNINSTTYRFSHVYPYTNETALRKERDGTFSEVLRPLYYEQVKYVNMGLLLGLKRSGGKTTIEDAMSEHGSIGARSRDLVSSCPGPLAERVLTCFIHHNSSVLREARVPWFLPERLGGLGLPSVGRWHAGDRELRLARKVLDSGVRIPAKPTLESYNVWRLANRRMGSMMKKVAAVAPYDFIYESSAGLCADDSYSEKAVVGLLCIEQLFRVKSVEQLVSASTGSKYLHDLQAMWKKMRVGVYPEPLNLSTLPPLLDLSSQKRYSRASVEEAPQRALPFFGVAHDTDL